MFKCSGCSRKNLSEDDFILDGKTFKSCVKCREKHRRHDSKRSKDPVRIEYNKTKNSEKKYYQKYRNRKRNEDYEKFKDHNTTHQRTSESYRISALKHSALKRKLPVEIDNERLATLMKTACFYCGFLNIGETLNGIDRIVSSIGYIESNCISCCSVCNYMKKCIDPLTFVKRCEQIINKTSYVDIWRQYKGTPYKTYKFSVEQRKINFDLSEDEYSLIRNEKCYYCWRDVSPRHKNGIDRRDNNIGYVVSNCVSCCGDCNYAKGVETEEIFIKQCSLITKNNQVASLPYIKPHLNMMKN